MGKLIIENRSSSSDLDCLKLVESVMEDGRISNDGKQYCYYTTMTFAGKRYGVATDLNKCSDRFVIVDDKHE